MNIGQILEWAAKATLLNESSGDARNLRDMIHTYPSLAKEVKAYTALTMQGMSADTARTVMAECRSVLKPYEARANDVLLAECAERMGLPRGMEDGHRLSQAIHGFLRSEDLLGCVREMDSIMESMTMPGETDPEDARKAITGELSTKLDDQDVEFVSKLSDMEEPEKRELYDRLKKESIAHLVSIGEKSKDAAGMVLEGIRKVNEMPFTNEGMVTLYFLGKD